MEALTPWYFAHLFTGALCLIIFPDHREPVSYLLRYSSLKERRDIGENGGDKNSQELCAKFGHTCKRL